MHVQWAVPDIRARIIKGGTLFDFIAVLLMVAVVALVAIILSTIIRTTVAKRRLIVDTAIEHLYGSGNIYNEYDPEQWVLNALAGAETPEAISPVSVPATVLQREKQTTSETFMWDAFS